MPSVRYTFSLDAVEDGELVRWLAARPNTSAAVRAALWAYVRRPTHADLAARLDEVLDALRTVRVAAPAEAEEEGGEPEAAVRGFDRMLRRFGRG